MNRDVDLLRTDQLIAVIKKYSVIWDTAHQEYLNKVEKGKTWASVITEFFPDFQQMPMEQKLEIETAMKKRWRSIRTCYGRELLKLKTLTGPEASKRKPYLHFDQLRFLDGVVSNKSGPAETEGGGHPERKPGKTKHNKMYREDSEDTVDKIQTKKVVVGVTSSECDATKDESGVQKRIFINENRLTQQEKEADKMFLLSLVSDLHKVPSHRKLQLKSDILLAIANAQCVSSDYTPNFIEVWQNESNASGAALPQFSSGQLPGKSDDRVGQEDVQSSAELPFIKVEDSGSFTEERETDIFDSEGSEISLSEGVSHTLREYLE